MKNMLSKILLGISALVVAGIVSVVPFNKVQAETYSYPANDLHLHYHHSDGTFTLSNMSGNVVFHYNGTGRSTRSFTSFDIDYYEADDSATFICTLEFNPSIPPEATGNVEFSFTLNNVAYYGNISLTNSQNSLDITYPISLAGYADTRNLQAADAFSRGINAKVNDIDMAFKGLNPDGTVNETKTVEYNYNYAISEKIIEKLSQAEGVTLLYTFEYEGYVFTSTITSEDAAKIFSKDIPWYGPCYIASNCPTVMVSVAV